MTTVTTEFEIGQDVYTISRCIAMTAKLGDVYPETDTRTAYELDCCDACFMAKVKPAIEALGVKFREWPADESRPYDVVRELAEEKT